LLSQARREQKITPPHMRSRHGAAEPSGAGMTASAISRKRLQRSNVLMAHMQEVIFCEQHGIATQIGYLGVPLYV